MLECSQGTILWEISIWRALSAVVSQVLSSPLSRHSGVLSPQRGIERTYQLGALGVPFSPEEFLLRASYSSPRLLDLSCHPIP